MPVRTDTNHEISQSGNRCLGRDFYPGSSQTWSSASYCSAQKIRGSISNMATMQINLKGSRRTKFCQDYCWVEKRCDVMNITCRTWMKEVTVI